MHYTVPTRTVCRYEDPGTEPASWCSCTGNDDKVGATEKMPATKFS